ncbi:hypothetical protein ACIP6X_09065 [Streptomyces coeruleorubidus]|uniref:zinc finger domain-containing protein n=1 Tax=Streptomyces coeruleorubidus TaxID=116188 RepID=UPI0038150AE7
MDSHEVAAVLAYTGRLDPRTIRTGTGEAQDQIGQWQELLDDVPFATNHGWDVAAREAAVTTGVPDALSVRCEWCHAPAGTPCRQRRASPDGTAKGNAVRATPHPSRIDLATARMDRQRAA